MRLNLGCGFNRLDGYLNLDKEEACSPDRVVDLEQFPWPLEDDCATEVILSHVLEHLGQSTETYLGIIRELYRISADGARVHIRAPHPRSDEFLADPTHVRPIIPDQFHLFSKKKNIEWREAGYANSQLGLRLDVDFEVESVEYFPSEDWLGRMRAGEVTSEEMAIHQFNVIEELEIELRVIKKSG